MGCQRFVAVENQTPRLIRRIENKQLVDKHKTNGGIKNMKTKQITKQMEEKIMNAHVSNIHGGVTYYSNLKNMLLPSEYFDIRDMKISSHNYEFEFKTLWENPTDAEFYRLNYCTVGQGFNARKARTRMFELDNGLWTVWMCKE